MLFHLHIYKNPTFLWTYEMFLLQWLLSRSSTPLHTFVKSYTSWCLSLLNSFYVLLCRWCPRLVSLLYLIFPVLSSFIHCYKSPLSFLCSKVVRPSVSRAFLLIKVHLNLGETLLLPSVFFLVSLFFFVWRLYCCRISITSPGISELLQAFYHIFSYVSA